jgi:hypothetical protein
MTEIKVNRMEAPGVEQLRRSVVRAIAPGALAGLATIAAIALRGVREHGSGVAPINATSHVLWGDEAGIADGIDLKHTLPGLLINGLAGVFWAVVQQLLLERLPRRDRVGAAASGAVVAGLAYVVDYHLIPRRLTPGWELSVSRRSVAIGFTALGAALVLAGLLHGRR